MGTGVWHEGPPQYCFDTAGGLEGACGAQAGAFRDVLGARGDMAGLERLQSRLSIGTLTGWQMLAEQVAASVPAAAASGSDASEPASEPAAAAARRARGAAAAAPGAFAAGGAPLARERSLGASSSMSEDSARTHSSGAAIAPRPHQWLYREYKVLEEIGSGGFGRVCRARRLADSRLVVVKEIKTSALTPKQKAATMDEVEVLAKLDHPNIVHYHDCFVDDVYCNIVMEFCDSGDLADVVKARGGAYFPEDEVMRLFVQVALGLHYVHSQGVLHRDLKPSNVLVASSGLLKIGDFGVSKISNTDASMASTIVGTPHYLSPEMCDNKPYGRKSDVWALGCLLVELCTLQKAFESSSISKIILSIMAGKHAPLPDCYSPELRALAAGLMQVDPAARPAVHEILAAPFVRHHLQRHLEWARGVPDARVDTLLLSLQGPGLAEPRPRAGRPAFVNADALAASARGRGEMPLPAYAQPGGGGGGGGLLASLGSCASSCAAATPRSGSATAAAGMMAAQEQLEGIKRLRGMKARLRLSCDGGGGGFGAPVYEASLASAMSVDSCASHAAVAARAAAA